MRGSWMIAIGGVVLFGAGAFAQGKAPEKEKAKPQGSEQKEQREVVPPSHTPPAGLCRIWLNGVPAAQQPAPTDCASAVRNRPRNARVIFPEEKGAPLVKQLQPLRARQDPRNLVPKKPEARDPRTPAVRTTPVGTPPTRKPPEVKKPDDPVRPAG